jgi:hypothetical protein
MRFQIGWIGKTLLLLLSVRGIPKESLMLEGKKGVHMWIILDDDHEDEFKDEDDQASLNSEGRFVPRGERRGRGFQRDPRWQNGIDRNLGNIKMKIPWKMILKRPWNGRKR